MMRPGKKKKSPFFFFLAAFFAIVVVMFIANSTNVNVLEGQLDVPGGGLLKLYTVSDSLVGISPTSEVYVWNWQNLVKEPKVGSAPAKDRCLVWVPGDKLVWIPSDGDDTIVISDFKSGREVGRVSLGYGWRAECLALSNNGKFIALAALRKSDTSKKDGFYESVRLDMMSADSEDFSKVITIDAARDNLVMESLAISDDGRFIAVVGQRNGIGWVGLVGIKNKKLLWEKSFESSEEFREVAFAAGSSVVYAGWAEKFVYSFEAATGKELIKWLVDDGRKSTQEERMDIRCITVSNDNRFLAVGREVPGTAWVWDIKRGGKPKVFSCGNVHITDIAFSPDSTLMVTTSFKVTSKTRIWRITDAF
jgi:WD40 repeat protein